MQNEKCKESCGTPVAWFGGKEPSLEICDFTVQQDAKVSIYHSPLPMLEHQKQAFESLLDFMAILVWSKWTKMLNQNDL